MIDDSDFTKMSNGPLHYPLLIIDTASRKTMVGIKTDAETLLSKSEDQDPSKSLFKLVESALEATSLQLSDLATLIFCEGPGSMLGARTASMAIRTWQAIGIPAASNLYSYNSLQAAAALAAESQETSDQGIVATDARRASWNTIAYPATPDSKLELIENENLLQTVSPLVTFPEFPIWTKTDARFQSIPYEPISLFTNDRFESFLRSVNTASPLTIRTNEFKKWDAKIHTSPTP